MSCKCQDCGKQFKVDINLNDNDWKKISYRENLLCGHCIIDRIEQRGYSAWKLEEVAE